MGGGRGVGHLGAGLLGSLRFRSDEGKLGLGIGGAVKTGRRGEHMGSRVNIAGVAAFMLAVTLLPDDSSAQAGGVKALSWMAGSWATEKHGKREEEHWMAPRAGLMVGMHRDARTGKPASFEFFRIQERPDGVFYLSQPGGAPVTSFKLVEQAARRVVFENPEHDFPQRIIYWQDSPRELRAMIAGTMNGKADSMQWRWTRSKLAP